MRHSRYFLGVVLLALAVSPVRTAADGVWNSAASLAATESKLKEDGRLVSTQPAVALNASQSVLASILASGDPPQMVYEKIRAELDVATAFSILGDLKAGYPIAQRALSDVSKVAPGSALDGRIRILVGDLENTRGDIGKALENYRAALSIEKSIGDMDGEIIVLSRLAEFYTIAKDFKRAIKIYDQILDLSRTDLKGQTVAYNNRGFVYIRSGDYQHGFADFTKAYEGAARFKSGFIEGHALTNRALCDIKLGDLNAAERDIDLAGQVLSGSEAASERPFVLGLRAMVAGWRGNWRSAEDYISQAFAGIDLKNSDPVFLEFHRFASEVYQHTHKFELAYEHANAVLRIVEQTDANALLQRATVLEAEVNVTSSAVRAEKAARERQETVLVWVVGSTLLLSAVSVALIVRVRGQRKVLQKFHHDIKASEQVRVDERALVSMLISSAKELSGFAESIADDSDLPSRTRERAARIGLESRIVVARRGHSLSTTGVGARPFDLAQILRDGQSPWREVALARGIVIDDVFHALPVRVIADPEIIDNLVSCLLAYVTPRLTSCRLSFIAEFVHEMESCRLTVADQPGYAALKRKVLLTGSEVASPQGGEDEDCLLKYCLNVAASSGGSVFVSGEEDDGVFFGVSFRCLKSDANENLVPLHSIDDTGAAVEGLAGGVVLVIAAAAPLTRLVRQTFAGEPCQLEFVPTALAALERIEYGPVERCIVSWAGLRSDQDGDLSECLSVIRELAVKTKTMVVANTLSLQVRDEISRAGGRVVFDRSDQPGHFGLSLVAKN